MKKIDKILDFLFHTKRGVGILVGLAFVVVLTFTGCFSECADCFGCGDCGSGCNNCKISCGNCQCTFTDCDDAGCDLSCTGCNRNSCQCGTCVCTQTPSCAGCGCGSNGGSSSQSSNSVRLYVKLPSGQGKNVYVSKKIQNGYTVADLSSVSVDSDTAKYYSTMGYYTTGGVLAVGIDGVVKDAEALLGASGSSIGGYNLQFGGTEAKLGEPVLVAFSSEHEELIMNTIRVNIGAVITNFPTPELEGHTLEGWRLKDSEDAPIVSVVNGETVFHLYDFKADLTNSIVLEPIFKAN